MSTGAKKWELLSLIRSFNFRSVRQRKEMKRFCYFLVRNRTPARPLKCWSPVTTVRSFTSAVARMNGPLYLLQIHEANLKYIDPSYTIRNMRHRLARRRVLPDARPLCRPRRHVRPHRPCWSAIGVGNSPTSPSPPPSRHANRFTRTGVCGTLSWPPPVSRGRCNDRNSDRQPSVPGDHVPAGDNSPP